MTFLKDDFSFKEEKYYVLPPLISIHNMYIICLMINNYESE